MFFFFNKNYKTCDDNLSPCRQSLCSSFDSEWNRICPSGNCGDDFFDSPPPYYRNYAPCCWYVTISGSKASLSASSGLCGPTCDMDGSYYTTSSPLSIWESGDTSYVKARLAFSSAGDGNCVPLGTTFETYYSEQILGSYDSCGFDCRGLNLTFDNFTAATGIATALCDFSNVTVTYSGVYNNSPCKCSHAFNGGWNLFNGVSDSGLINVGNCFNALVSLGQVIGYTYYNACGNSRTMSFDEMNERYFGFCIKSLEVVGVSGYDDNIPDISGDDYTCRVCGNLNKTWYPGDSFPSCGSCKLSFKDWEITLAHPSSIIELNAYNQSSPDWISQWVASTPSGIYPSSPLRFDYVQQNESGWQRCDFTNSYIDMSHSLGNFEFKNMPVLCSGDKPDDCCPSCLDGYGAEDLLVTVDNVSIPVTHCYHDGDTYNGVYIVSKARRYGRVFPDGTNCGIDPCLSGLLNTCFWEYQFDDCPLPTGCGCSALATPDNACVKWDNCIKDQYGLLGIGAPFDYPPCCLGSLYIEMSTYPYDTYGIPSGLLTARFHRNAYCWGGNNVTAVGNIPLILSSGAACGSKYYKQGKIDCNNLDVTCLIPSGSFVDRVTYGGTIRVQSI